MEKEPEGCMEETFEQRADGRRKTRQDAVLGRVSQTKAMGRAPAR